MTWTALKPAGSWGVATSSAPATDMATILALPGSWPWYPTGTALVRKDQWGALLSPPAVDAVSPNTGGIAGGTPVVITGHGLIGSTGVTFGGTAGTSFSVVNDTQVNVTTPAKAAGAVNVVVANPRGNVTVANSYTYA
jgi:hypothetical protein